MIKYFTLVFVVLILGFKYSEAQVCSTNQLNLHQITATEFKPYYLQYDGHPFYFENWEEGDLTLVSGEVYSNLNLKIDLYKDEVIYFNKKLNTQLTIDKKIIKSINLHAVNNTSEILNHQRVDSTKQIVSNLYFVLHTDSISLWCKRSKDINVNTEFTSRYAKLGTFYSKDKYYFVIDGELTRFPLRKGKLLSYFPDKKNELATIIRKKKYYIKNEQHLSQIFKEINRLSK